MIRLVVHAKEGITICKESGFKITTFDLLYYFDKSELTILNVFK